MIIHYPDVFLSSASTCIQLLALRSAANAALKLTRSTEAEAAALVPQRCWKIQAFHASSSYWPWFWINESIGVPIKSNKYIYIRIYIYLYIYTCIYVHIINMYIDIYIFFVWLQIIDHIMSLCMIADFKISCGGNWCLFIYSVYMIICI